MSPSTKTAHYAFGGITALSVVSGAVFLAMALFAGVSPSKLNDADAPYTAYFFFGFCVANLVFLVLLGLAAIRLLRLDFRGIHLLALTLKLELAYWLLLTGLWLLPPLPISMSAGAATGIGNMGISPQLCIAYPVTGLIAIWGLRRLGIL